MASLPIFLAIAAVMMMSSLGNVASQCPVDWFNVPFNGVAKSCSVGNSNTIVCLNTAGELQRWNPAISITSGGIDGWITLPGSFVSASIGNDRDLWAATNTGAVYRWANNQWNIMNNNQSLGSMVSVASSQYVELVTPTGVLFRWVPSTKTWSQYRQSVSSTSIGTDGDMWVTDNWGNIYRYNAGAWPSVAGSMTQIAVADKSHVFGINVAGLIFNYSSGTWKQCPGMAQTISAGNGLVAIVSGGLVYIGI